jgi:acetyl esterase/lipase
MALQYDAEFAALAGPALKVQSVELPLHDVQARRARMEAFVAGVRPGLPVGVEQIIHHVKASDGHEVPIYHLHKKDAATDSGLTPAILHIHGGGYIGVSAEDSTPSIAPYVSSSGVPIFSVDYRLAPENPFPIPLEDCWAALLWLQAHAEEFGIDLTRVAVMGESAGGGLAAGLAQLARDRVLSPPLAKQILIYPMIDDRTVSDFTGGLAIFAVSDVITGWAAYLGAKYGTDEVSPYAAAARITDVKGLPPLYLDVGHLDMFAHENLAYVQKFVAANIPTEFHLYTGVPHAFHRFAPTARVTQRAFANRVGAMLSL